MGKTIGFYTMTYHRSSTPPQLEPQEQHHHTKFKLRRLTTKRLMDLHNDQASFNKWLASHRTSKSSRQTDLPSSHLPSKASLVSVEVQQLFVIIDTCSIVSYRTEFMDHVTRLNDLFSDRKCPVKFVISLPVLEELDKFNRRPPRKRRSDPVKREPVAATSSDKNNNNNNTGALEDPSDPVLCELLAMARGQSGTTSDQPSNTLPRSSGASPTPKNQLQGPPRMFARFIEEEIRMGERITGELDPHKEIPLQAREVNFEIVNHDDRILDCCIRTRAFIQRQEHHPGTIIILVSEDNVFKSKATTFDIPSYRWREFLLKFKNFGLNNYVSTPLLPNRSDVASNVTAAAAAATSTHLNRIPRLNPISTILRRPPFTPLASSGKVKSEVDGVIFVEEVINIE